jgi:hypothetical protein
MLAIYLSYARADASKASQLAEDIRSLGFNVWMDKELNGGQMWWDEILSQIKQCDVFVFSVSDASCGSIACMRELSYAESLGKSVIPVLVDRGLAIGALPCNLGERQLVKYLDEDRGSAIRLAKSLLNAQSPRPLPANLPEPPQVPLSYLARIASEINKESLSLQEQSQMLLALKEGLTDNTTRSDALQIMQRLSRRRDLFAIISKEVDGLLFGSKSLPSNRGSHVKFIDNRGLRPPIHHNGYLCVDVKSELARASYSGGELITIKIFRVLGIIILIYATFLSVFILPAVIDNCLIDSWSKHNAYCWNEISNILHYGFVCILLFWSMTMRLWFYKFLTIPFRLVFRWIMQDPIR